MSEEVKTQKSLKKNYPSLEVEVVKEVVSITELDSDEAVILVDEEFITSLPRSKQGKVLKSFLLLGQDFFLKEEEEVVEEQKILISEEEVHKEVVMELKFTLDEDGDFKLFYYWGGRADPTTPLKKALLHAASVVNSVSEQL